jgi:hypothetical protein
MSKIENLVYKMLTTNTGSHMLDSGGVGGRMHERNAKLSLKDFRARPEATLELIRERSGSLYPDVTIDVFHYLTNALSLDEVCNKFNSRKVSNWDSTEFYGVSDKGQEFLLTYFKVEGESFNTYNYDSNFSQILQGRELIHLDSGDKYVLLQVHGGADARGGYTDAKLFRLEAEFFLYENASFDSVDWSSEFINHEGQSATNEDFELLFNKYKTDESSTQVTIEGTLFND